MTFDEVHHVLTGANRGRVTYKLRGSRQQYADAVLIRGAYPRVSEAIWRSSRTASASGGAKRKVCAWIRGEVIGTDATCHGPFSPMSNWRRIRFNPSRHAPGSVPTFTYADTGEAWSGAALVLVTGGYAYELNR